MKAKIEFEFETYMSHGSKLSVVGYADVLLNCDCHMGATFPHPHIEDVILESTAIVATDGTLTEIDPESKDWRELEILAEGKVYGMLEAA